MRGAVSTSTAKMRANGGTDNHTDGLGKRIVQAGVPVDDDDDVHDQIGDTKKVRVVGSGFCPLKKLQHPEAHTDTLG